MERISQNQQDELSRYLDGAMNTAEKKRMEEALESSESLKACLVELKAVHELLQTSKLDHPSKNFTSIVMGKLDQYPFRSPGISVRNGIFLLVGVLLAVGIGSVLVSAGVFDGAVTTVNLDTPAIVGKLIKRSMPAIPFNGKLVVNVIILLNLGLAWIVLDRAILRPLFQRRLEAGD